MTTLARPLSAGRNMMESSCFRLLSASRISFVMLGSGGSACWRIPLTALLTVSACSASSCLTASSTLAMISVAGIFAGVTVKFKRKTYGETYGETNEKLCFYCYSPRWITTTFSTKLKFLLVVFSEQSLSRIQTRHFRSFLLRKLPTICRRFPEDFPIHNTHTRHRM